MEVLVNYRECVLISVCSMNGSVSNVNVYLWQFFFAVAVQPPEKAPNKGANFNMVLTPLPVIIK